MKNNSDYSAIIIGAGVATGSALTKKFAKEGYNVCPVRRERRVKSSFKTFLFLETYQIFC